MSAYTLIGTVETHHVAAQTVRFWRTEDGEIVVACDVAAWTDNPWTDTDVLWSEAEESCERSADRIATRLGVHPVDIWPDWYEATAAHRELSAAG